MYTCMWIPTEVQRRYGITLWLELEDIVSHLTGYWNMILRFSDRQTSNPLSFLHSPKKQVVKREITLKLMMFVLYLFVWGMKVGLQFPMVEFVKRNYCILSYWSVHSRVLSLFCEWTFSGRKAASSFSLLIPFCSPELHQSGSPSVASLSTHVLGMTAICFSLWWMGCLSGSFGQKIF